MSASLPSGTRNTAAASRKAVATQLNCTAFMANSAPMAGKATFTAEPRKGGRNEPVVVASRTRRCRLAG